MNKVEKFFHRDWVIDRKLMLSRIKSTTSALGWQETVTRMIEIGKPFEDIRVAEVGCGTGTFSLTLNLLGTSSTLIDGDQDALNTAEKVFSLYHREAEYVLANVLHDPTEHLKGQFDVVISGGLAEHFRGEDRLRCLKFHQTLCNDGGFIYIGVPNRLSLGYQMVRLIKELTGQWTIDCEIPYTYWELKALAIRLGLSDGYVLGNSPLTKDIKDYSYAFLAALAAVLPENLRATLKPSWGSSRIDSDFHTYSSDGREEKEIVDQAMKRTKLIYRKRRNISPKDVLSAGIILFAVNRERL
jgi:2-polyprenyl-3-methyl-5-hydroxy-6-metoxy-1,4-benzoquinol methylase